MIVKTAVNSQVKRDALFKGTLFAGLGMTILIGGSVLLSREQLNGWGLVIFLVGISFVTTGMIPYRRLTRLENAPDEIHLNDDHTWSYYSKGIKVAEIPEQTIDSVAYLSKESHYGICMKLKKHPEDKVRVFNQNWQASHAGKFGCDLFLPYFSERSVHHLQNHGEM